MQSLAPCLRQNPEPIGNPQHGDSTKHEESAGQTNRVAETGKQRNHKESLEKLFDYFTIIYFS